MFKNWLRDARKAKGLTQVELAERIGSTQSAVFKWEKGERKLSAPIARRAAAVLGVTPEFLLFGNGSNEGKVTNVDYPVPVRTVAPVLGTAGAGGWMELDEMPGRITTVPVVPGRYEDIEQFAYKVVGSSMDAAGMPDGSFVICIKEEPRSGDVVVLERRRGQLFQRSVKELVVSQTHLEFRPRSTDPSFAPLRVPRDERLMEDDDTQIVVVGRVIATVNYLP